MLQNDVLIINGCCIRLPEDLHNPLVVRHSSGNNIVFSASDHIIDIIHVEYTTDDTLAVMLTAMSRYAYLTQAEGVVCNPDIPVNTISLIDGSGILDHSYT